jgi:hypothetical protein
VEPPENDTQEVQTNRTRDGDRDRSEKSKPSDERLKEVEVLPVDKRHVDRSALKLANRLQATEAAADDDDPPASALTRQQRHSRFWS